MKAEHYLIVSADDFGLVPSVTEGIIEGLSNGCITETTILQHQIIVLKQLD